jgi:hypothetical protein
MITALLTSCSLFEGSVESSLALRPNNLHEVCTLWVAVFLMMSSQSTGLPGCPVRVVPIAVMRVVHGVHAPMLFAEAAVLLSPMDRPLVGVLQNMGIDQLHLPF